MADKPTDVPDDDKASEADKTPGSKSPSPKKQKTAEVESEPSKHPLPPPGKGKGKGKKSKKGFKFGAMDDNSQPGGSGLQAPNDPQPGGSGLQRPGGSGLQRTTSKAPSVASSRATVESSVVDPIKGGVLSIGDDSDEYDRNPVLEFDDVDEFNTQETHVRNLMPESSDSDDDAPPTVLTVAAMRKAEEKKRRREQAGQTTNVRRQKKTPLWQHFKLAAFKSPRKSGRSTKIYYDAVCQVVVVDSAHPEGKKCGATLARVDGTTGGMRSHLHSKHGDVYAKYIEANTDFKKSKDKGQKAIEKAAAEASAYDAFRQCKKVFLLNLLSLNSKVV